MTKTTYTLEMSSPDQFRRKESEVADFVVSRVAEPYPELSKFLHTFVGHPWRWGGRKGWGESEWASYVSRSGFEMWVAYRSGTPVGYFELLMHDGDDVEVLTFGLASRFIGQGLGGPLLTAAVDRAWDMGAAKVWLGTCSHDHPHAKNNYLARGFEIVETVEEPGNLPIPSFWELVAGH